MRGKNYAEETFFIIKGAVKKIKKDRLVIIFIFYDRRNVTLTRSHWIPRGIKRHTMEAQIYHNPKPRSTRDS